MMKKIISIIILLLIAVPVLGATNLYEYFQEQGEVLPTISERIELAEECGIENYEGTYTQNIELLDCLQAPKLGATIPILVSGISTTLASKITASSTSLTLTSATDDAGNALAGYMCFTIDVNSASEERVCGTVSGTTVSSLLRGVNPLTGNTEVYSLKRSHRRGSSIIGTDFPIVLFARILNGDETLPNVLSYASQPTFDDDEQIITKKYADDLAIAGAPAGSTTTAGILEVADTDELINFTATTGSSGKLLIPYLGYFATSTDKRGATTTIPMTGSDGKLSYTFINETGDLTILDSNESNGYLFGIQDYSDVSNITLQSQTSGDYSGLNLFSKDGDATDGNWLSLWGKGTPSSISNGEELLLGWNSSNSYYQINTFKVGSGTARDLNIYTHGNTDQLYLEVANGRVGIGTTTPEEMLDVDGNVIIDGTITISTIGSSIASSTFTGTSTFNGIPELPDYDPSGDNMAVRKKYVDDVYPDFSAGTGLFMWADLEENAGGVSGAWEIAKEMKLGRDGTLRIKHSAWTSNSSYSCKSKIYRNGGAVGTERTTNSTSPQEYSQDISGWSKGDLIQVYIANSGVTQTGRIKNFRLYIANADQAIPAIVTNP